MKKRRTLIISLLLVAALCLGIGYAALSRDLQINGSANLQGNNEVFDSAFISGSITDSEMKDDTKSPATVSVTEGSTTASYTIDGLAVENDTVEMTFVVKNSTTDVVAHLTGITSTNGELKVTTPNGDVDGSYADYFSKSIKVLNAAGTEYVQGQDFVVNPGEEARVIITVTLNQSITNPVSATSFVTLHFSGTN